jgi:hypothetical protein
MGLLNWLKGEKPSTNSAQRPASAASGSTTQSAPKTSAVIDLEPLVLAARNGEPGAMERVWAVVMLLDTWHFIDRRPPQQAAAAMAKGTTDWSAFILTLEGQPAIAVFSTESKASSAGAARAWPEGFTVVSVPTPAAIAQIEQLKAAGVTRAVFDDGVGGGFFAPIDNLLPMFALARDLPLAKASDMCGTDTAHALHNRLSQTGQTAHFRELIEWTIMRPAWWVFVDESNEHTLRTWGGAGTNGRVTAVFTDETRARAMCQRMNFPESCVRRWTPADTGRLLRSLSEQSPGLEVAINMRQGIDAKTLSAIFG